MKNLLPIITLTDEEYNEICRAIIEQCDWYEGIEQMYYFDVSVVEREDLCISIAGWAYYIANRELEELFFSGINIIKYRIDSEFEMELSVDRIELENELMLRINE